jgi:two-component system sensor histidine kinase UhpB
MMPAALQRGLWTSCHRTLGWMLLLLCWHGAVQAAPECQPRILSTLAARSPADTATRPQEGWEPVALPDLWQQRWPDHQGDVWYRIDWEPGCRPEAAAEGPSPPAATPLGLAINSIQMTGEIHLNDGLLWRDTALSEPMSLSWNMPRWWTLPQAALRPGTNTLWIRVVCPPELSPGLGRLFLGTAEQAEAEHDNNRWRQRTAYLLTAGLSGAVGGVFLVVWLLRRQEHAFGWYALMSLCWMLYLATMLVTRPWPVWPFDTATGMSRLNLLALLGYTLCFCLFTFRFGAQQLPRTERVLKLLIAAGALAMLLVPLSGLYATSLAVFLGCSLAFFLNCLQFQWHAWRRPLRQGQRAHQGLALCWLLFLIVGVHDLIIVLGAWAAHDTWIPATGPITTLLMALLLGTQLAASLRRSERFNQELTDSVAQARSDLAQALAREHASALENTRLHTMQQERTQLAHDLHDGLGASLVRSMAVIEQAQRSQLALPGERVLALFKQLRDDLRQVIDYGSSATSSLPDTPELWIAPLRHRFMRILEELGVESQWDIAPQWHALGPRPDMVQCLGLSRILEEALTNVIKHSQASQLRVHCDLESSGLLRLSIEDNGRGFNPQAQQQTGLSVGLRSMAARAARMGGRFELHSAPGATSLCIEVPLHASPTTPHSPCTALAAPGP